MPQSSHEWDLSNASDKLGEKSSSDVHTSGLLFFVSTFGANTFDFLKMVRAQRDIIFTPFKRTEAHPPNDLISRFQVQQSDFVQSALLEGLMN